MSGNRLIEELFSPGTAVKLELAAEEGVIKNYSTSVADLEDQYITLRTPIIKGKPVEISEGREISLSKKEDRYKQVYVASVFVVENRAGKNPMLVCTKPVEISRTSLRRYSRFETNLDCRLSSGDLSATGIVTDLSLCGFRIAINPDHKINKGSILDLAVFLSKNSELLMVGEVVRIFNTSGNNSAVIAFDIREITVSMQEILKNHLFQCQLIK